MSYQFYKILHLTGLVTLFITLGAIAFAGSDRRKILLALNGIAAAVMFVAGFGLLARLQLFNNVGTWVWLKIAIWLILGATPVILRKKPDLAMPVLIGSIALGAVAASLAIYKP